MYNIKEGEEGTEGEAWGKRGKGRSVAAAETRRFGENLENIVLRPRLPNGESEIASPSKQKQSAYACTCSAILYNVLAGPQLPVGPLGH